MRILSGLTMRLIELLPLSVHGPRQAPSGAMRPRFARRQSRAIGDPLSSRLRMLAASAESAVVAGLKMNARSFPPTPSQLMSPETRGVNGAPDRATTVQLRRRLLANLLPNWSWIL